MSSFPIETLSEDRLLPFLAGEVRRLADASPTKAHPVFLHTLGVPGAGKSSIMPVLRKALGSLLCTYVAFDRLMESIPEYQTDPDRERAFKTFELPARAAGYALLKRMVEKRASILLEHGGSFALHIEMLRFVRETLGYRVIMVHIPTSPETAKKRIWARQAIDGRHTPLTYVDQRFAIIQELLPQYHDVADAFFDIPNEQDCDDPYAVFGPECMRIAECWRVFEAV